MAQEDKSLVLVRKIQGHELLPPNVSRQLEKICLQVVTKQKGLELLLSGTDTPTASAVDMVAVESEVSKSGNGFRLEARLINVKTKTLLSKVALDNIREDDLLRLFQGAIESIFLQYDWSEEKEAKEAKGAKDAKMSVPPLPAKPKKIPNTTQTTAPAEDAIDFAKRVRDLKAGVDKEIIKTAEEKKEEAAKDKDPEKNSSIAMLKGNLLVDEDLMKKINKPKVYPRQFRFAVGMDRREITSTGLVDTTTKAQMVNLRVLGHNPTSFFNGKIAWSYDLTYTKAQTATVATPAMNQLGLYATWLSTHWNLSAGIFRDASFFVNLPEPGVGLQPSSLTSVWTKIKTDIVLPFKYPIKIGASYGSVMQGQSDYKPISGASAWQGTYTHLDFSPHFLVYGCEFNVMTETLNLTTQGEIPFTFNESRLGLSIRRSL